VSGGVVAAVAVAAVAVAVVAVVDVVLINPKNKLSLLLSLLLVYRGCVKNGFSRANGGGGMSRRFKNGFLVMFSGCGCGCGCVAVALRCVALRLRLRLLIIAHHHFNSVLRINHYGLGDSGKTA
jgi:hypothetical protein